MTGFNTLFYKEILRFWKVATQTLTAPIVTAMLYLLIFGHVLEEHVQVFPGVSYTGFLVPGLVMMSVLQNSFANSSSSLIQSKITGNLVFILLTPLSHWEMFGAYVLALDYAWSGRKEMPDQLPYDPIREWTRRFYARPKPMLPRDGYRLVDSMVFKDITSSVNNHRLDKISIILDKTYSVTGLTCQTFSEVILPEGSPVAEIELYENENLIRKFPLRYAAEIRARTDRRPVHTAIDGQDPHTYWHFWEKEEKVDRIRINLIQPGGGLNLKNLQLIKTSE